MLKVQVPRDSPYGDLNARSSAKVLQQPLVAQACKVAIARRSLREGHWTAWVSGDLQVDDACVGPPGTKVLFWMTGVGVLAAKIQPTIDEDPLRSLAHTKLADQ